MTCILNRKRVVTRTLRAPQLGRNNAAHSQHEPKGEVIKNGIAGATPTVRAQIIFYFFLFF